MRVYEGAPRQNYQEVLRSVGALIDQRGMREILLTEGPDGFILQGLVPVGEAAWGESSGRLEKETLQFAEDDIARFMDEALARRRAAEPFGAPPAPIEAHKAAGFYEHAMRVLGAYIDQQKPRDVFFLEQEHAFVVRLLMPTRAGAHHVLAEFTADDIQNMIDSGPQLRTQPDEEPQAAS